MANILTPTVLSSQRIVPSKDVCPECRGPLAITMRGYTPETKTRTMIISCLDQDCDVSGTAEIKSASQQKTAPDWIQSKTMQQGHTQSVVLRGPGIYIRIQAIDAIPMTDIVDHVTSLRTEVNWSDAVGRL